jgi:2'-5' RNA ligase
MPARLFVGVPVPPSAAYAQVTQEAAAELAAARPVPAGSWHLTLRFLGEVLDDRPLRDALGAALRGRPALPCVVEGLGAFPNAKQARVLWAGVRVPGVDGLAAAVEEATAPFGEPPERRRFVAHATLARLGRPADVRSLLARRKDTLLAQGVLDRVVLYDSRVSASGPAYAPVQEWRLGTA